ncbi:MAG TPA: hypothetical protein VJ821_09470 [Anaerolineales bacterium]|nr:hypothetical protein [Anaerolineales bacterium]
MALTNNRQLYGSPFRSLGSRLHQGTSPPGKYSIPNQREKLQAAINRGWVETADRSLKIYIILGSPNKPK